MVVRGTHMDTTILVITVHAPTDKGEREKLFDFLRRVWFPTRAQWFEEGILTAHYIPLLISPTRLCLGVTTLQHFVACFRMYI